MHKRPSPEPPGSAQATADDRSLLAGFRFGCRPGCGLCCYTSPAVRAEERTQLIHLDPAVPLADRGDRWSRVASRPDGGACYFLRQSRCGCHAVRPATCAEFPIFAHLTDRVQLSLVLGCPGLTLDALDAWSTGNPPEEEAVGLEAELSAVLREVELARSYGDSGPASRRWRSLVRRLERRSQWTPLPELRARLARRVDSLIPTELGPPDPGPEPDDAGSLESLPLFFDDAAGPTAWRNHPGGVELLELKESGGIEAYRAVIPEPRVSPGLEPSARLRLRGYLGYLLGRDATVDAAVVQMEDSGPRTTEDAVAADLGRAAARVVRLATVRRALRSADRGPLARDDIDRGIRATDMDFLDRPTAGVRL